MEKKVDESGVASGIEARRQTVTWVAAGIIALLTLPFFAGFVYPILMLPFYSYICLGRTSATDVVASASNPVDVANYIYFLSGKGCKIPPPPPPSYEAPCTTDDPQCSVNGVIRKSLETIGPGYHGVHQYFNEGLISWRRYMGEAYPRAAYAGTMWAVELHNTNTLFQAFTLLVFGVIAIAFPVIIKRASERIADWLVKGKSSGKD